MRRHISGKCFVPGSALLSACLVIVATAFVCTASASAVVITQHETKTETEAENVFAWPGGVVLASIGGPVDQITTAPAFSLTPRTTGVGASTNKVVADQVTLGPNGNLWFLGGARQTLPNEQEETYTGIYEITNSAAVLRFRYPNYVAGEMITGPDGALWIADWTTGHIDRYDPGTNQLTAYSVDGTPVSLVSGPDSSIWFTDSKGYIGQITMQGEVAEHLIEDGDSEGPLGFMKPYGITVGPDGALWFTEQSGRIGRMTPTWQLQEFTIPNPQQLLIGDGGPEPRYIVAGPDGAMWFTDPGDNAIGRITLAGEITEYSIPGAADVVPNQIASGPEGLLWFTESNSKQVGSIDPNATPIPAPTSIDRVISRRTHCQGTGATSSHRRRAHNAAASKGSCRRGKQSHKKKGRVGSA